MQDKPLIVLGTFGRYGADGEDPEEKIWVVCPFEAACSIQCFLQSDTCDVMEWVGVGSVLECLGDADRKNEHGDTDGVLERICAIVVLANPVKQQAF